MPTLISTTEKFSYSDSELRDLIVKDLNVNPGAVSVQFCVDAEYDPNDTFGRYGPDYVFKRAVVTIDKNKLTII
jgi:hypothetical protein